MNRDEALAALVSLPEVQRISVASLKPTDVIVVNVSDSSFTQSEAARMRCALEQIWPDQKIIVALKGVEIAIAPGA
jgi:predicted pyridoxine 5'-phosphate oxidase superfamily flavin-nucleotide-binding protein